MDGWTHAVVVFAEVRDWGSPRHIGGVKRRTKWGGYFGTNGVYTSTTPERNGGRFRDARRYYIVGETVSRVGKHRRSPLRDGCRRFEKSIITNVIRATNVRGAIPVPVKLLGRTFAVVTLNWKPAADRPYSKNDSVPVG